MSGSDRRPSPTALRPGDVVSRPKGLVTHVGLVVDGGGVLHNVPGEGEHVTSLESFAAGKPVSVRRADSSARLRMLARAGHDVGGRDYHLLRNNCEHTVNRARDGHAHSPQLLEWTAGAAGAIAGTLLFRHWGAAAAGFEFGRRLVRRRRRD